MPGRGFKVVAVTLGEAILCANVAGDAFFEYLWLFAFVLYFGQQPEVIPVTAWVAGERHKVAGAQLRLVAAAVGQLLFGAVAFEVNLAELFAALAVAEATGVVVIFQIGLVVLLCLLVLILLVLI